MTRTPQEAREWAMGLLDALGTAKGLELVAAPSNIYAAAPYLARTVVTLVARVAELERDLAIECGEVTPPGWARVGSALLHRATSSTVYRADSGGYGWTACIGPTARDPKSRHAVGNATTIAAAVRAVEAYLVLHE